MNSCMYNHVLGKMKYNYHFLTISNLYPDSDSDSEL